VDPPAQTEYAAPAFRGGSADPGGGVMNDMFRWTLVAGLTLNFGCAGGEDTEVVGEICDNNTDDDGDGDADCDDQDCSADSACESVDEDCDNGRDDDGDGDEDCDDSECRNDAACEEIEYFEPFALTIEGQFGFDGTNVVAGIDADDEAIAISIVITLGDEDLWMTGTGNECVYVLALPGTATLPLETWTVDGTTQSGFILPSAEATLDTNCDDLDFDPEIWGTNFDELVLAFNWGVAIGDTTASVNKAIADAVKSGDLTEEDVPNFLGAGMFFELIGGTEEESAMNPAHYGFGYAVDEAMKLEVNDADENIPLVFDDVVTETGVPPRGFYVTASLGGFYATIFEAVGG
jgi:hypothetical protein